jgi:hypothetical protein
VGVGWTYCLLDEAVLTEIAVTQLSSIKKNYFVHIQCGSRQPEETLAIRKGWTYILSTKPRQRAASPASK